MGDSVLQALVKIRQSLLKEQEDECNFKSRLQLDFMIIQVQLLIRERKEYLKHHPPHKVDVLDGIDFTLVTKGV